LPPINAKKSCGKTDTRTNREPQKPPVGFFEVLGRKPLISCCIKNQDNAVFFIG
jgi:hypothetical protein